METADSLPHSQQPANCPYPEPDKSSPCLPTPLVEDSAWVLRIKNPSVLHVSWNWNPTINGGFRTATPLFTFGLRS